MSEFRKTIRTIEISWDAILEYDAETLLKVLKEERGKFTKSNATHIGLLIEALIEKGEYPAETQEGNPNSVRSMVNGWGAYWHRWSGTLECPHCKSDLRDREVGPPFMRAIGHTVNDRIVHYTCPDCEEKI